MHHNADGRATLSDPFVPPGGWLPGTFLSRLGPDESRQLLDLGTRREFRSGEPLIRQGEVGGDVFLLRGCRTGSRACVKVTCVVPNGSETLLAIRMAGDVVGEGAALHEDGRRAATMTACTDIVVQTIGQQRFLSYLDSRPKAWRVLSRLLSDRLEWANRRRLDFGGYPVDVRLVRVVLELVDAYGVPARLDLGVELGIELSQTELARLIGAKPDTVQRAMSRLKGQGLIRSRTRGVLVPDVAALRRVAEGD